MTILILHTYRTRTSNSGDWLIWHSLQQNIREITEEPMVHAFVQDPLTNKALGDARVVLGAAFSVFDDVYPNFAPLNGAPEALKVPFIPFGSTWQNPSGFPEQAVRFRLNPATQAFFQNLADRGGPIAVRDQQAQQVLTNNDIPAIFVGDCGLYDPAFIGQPMARPDAIRSLVFTCPHQKMFRHQALDLIDFLAREFPDARRVVSHQSLPGTYDEALAARAVEKGFGVMPTYQDPTLITGYDFDLHVGYRLHGHIALLRRRKPSVLLVEDARGEGFKTSFPVGAFSARSAAVSPELGAWTPADQWRRFVLPHPDAVDQVAGFLRQELATGFRRYSVMGDLIDRIYREAFMPTLREKLSIA